MRVVLCMYFALAFSVCSCTAPPFVVPLYFVFVFVSLLFLTVFMHCIFHVYLSAVYTSMRVAPFFATCLSLRFHTTNCTSHFQFIRKDYSVCVQSPLRACPEYCLGNLYAVPIPKVFRSFSHANELNKIDCPGSIIFATLFHLFTFAVPVF